MLMFKENKALTSTKAYQSFVSESTFTGYNNYSVIVWYSMASVSELTSTGYNNYSAIVC